MADPFGFEHKFVELPGQKIQLHYVESGPTEAVMTVVFVHGWPDLWFGWRHQLRALESKYRVIAPDLRGCGQSSKPKGIEHYGHKHLTTDLKELLDVLDVKQAVFIGHDWGGAVVYQMALYYPERVLALCAVGTPYYPRSEEYVAIAEKSPIYQYQSHLGSSDGKARDFYDANTRTFLNAVFRGCEDKSSFAILYGVIEDENLPKSNILSQEELDYYVSQYELSGFDGSLNFYRVDKKNWEDSAVLTTKMIELEKVLYIGIGQDKVLSPESSMGMEKYIPNLERALVKNAKHWILFEAKDEVNQILLNWLASINGELP